MGQIGENHVEEAALEWLAELGYAAVHGQSIAPDSITPERTSYGDVVLTARFDAALRRLNPGIPDDAIAEAKAMTLRSETQSLVEENRRLHRFLAEGVPVEVRRPEARSAANMCACWTSMIRPRMTGLR
jgi:type I restriction enzyme R subunit